MSLENLSNLCLILIRYWETEIQTSREIIQVSKTQTHTHQKKMHNKIKPQINQVKQKHQKMGTNKTGHYD